MNRITFEALKANETVRRNCVRNTDESTFDIHDRLNYSVNKSELKINEQQMI